MGTGVIRVGCGMLALVLAATMALGGCALGTRYAHLRYPPRSDGAATAAASPASVRATEILVLPLDDQRPDRDRVGAVRNGLGLATADIVTTDNLPNWIRAALRAELARAGYRVTDRAGAAPAARLSCAVAAVWTDAYFTYDGRIELAIRLEHGGREVLAKRYLGRGSAGVNWAATEEAYSESLALALADALTQLAADVGRALPAP